MKIKNATLSSLAISLTLVLVSLSAKAELSTTCNLINGNVNGRARVVVNQMVGASLEIDQNNVLHFHRPWSSPESFTPPEGPFNSQGLTLDGDIKVSKSGTLLVAHEHYSSCGRSSSTVCNDTAIYNTQTRKLRITSAVGAILRYTLVDYLLQCN